MEKIESLDFVERNGQTGSTVLYTVLFVVIALILIALGAYMVFAVQNQIPTTGLTTNQSTALTAIKDQSASTLNFANILPFILVAGGVILAVIGLVSALRA